MNIAVKFHLFIVGCC